MFWNILCFFSYFIHKNVMHILHTSWHIVTIKNSIKADVHNGVFSCFISWATDMIHHNVKFSKVEWDGSDCQSNLRAAVTNHRLECDVMISSHWCFFVVYFSMRYCCSESNVRFFFHRPAEDRKCLPKQSQGFCALHGRLVRLLNAACLNMKPGSVFNSSPSRHNPLPFINTF